MIHTPLILRLPRGEHGGKRHEAIAQTVDILPTIFGALGLPPVETAHGYDLLPLVRGDITKVRDYACLGMDVEEFAIRTHDWHLIVPLEVDPEDPPRPVALYRKPEDRWERERRHRAVPRRRRAPRTPPPPVRRRRPPETPICPTSRPMAARPFGSSRNEPVVEWEHDLANLRTIPSWPP